MGEELKEEKCKCFCKSKGFRKFLINALGTFVGVFCALSLFCALHKPPMMMYGMPYGHPPMMKHFYMNKDMHKFPMKHFDREKLKPEKIEHND